MASLINATMEVGCVADDWSHGNDVMRGEVLATFIQTTFAWTDTQMDTLMIATAAIQL
jgi:hypothetical protein